MSYQYFRKPDKETGPSKSKGEKGQRWKEKALKNMLGSVWQLSCLILVYLNEDRQGKWIEM